MKQNMICDAKTIITAFSTHTVLPAGINPTSKNHTLRTKPNLVLSMSFFFPLIFLFDLHLF